MEPVGKFLLLRGRSLLSQVCTGRQGHHTLLRCLIVAEKCLEKSEFIFKSSSVCSQPDNCLHLSYMTNDSIREWYLYAHHAFTHPSFL